MAEGEKRKIQGWGSVEIKDSDGELIPMEVLKTSMPAALEREAPITLNHTDTIIGKLTSYDFRENTEAGAEGLWIEAEIFQDPDQPLYDEVWERIKPGEEGQTENLSQFSLGGQYELDGDGTAKWISPMTIAVTEKGANEAADIEKKESGSMAKEDEEKKEDIKKEDDGKKDAEKEDKKEDELDKAGEQGPQFYGKEEGEKLRKAVEDQGARLQKIEDMLDTLVHDEEVEKGTDQAIEEKEELGKEPDPKEDKKDELKKTLAQHAKKIEALETENKELKVKMSKYESAGIKRTLPSGSAPPAEDPMEETLKRMGI